MLGECADPGVGGPDTTDNAGVPGGEDAVGLGGADSAYCDSSYWESAYWESSYWESAYCDSEYCESAYCESSSASSSSSATVACTLVWMGSVSDMMPWEMRKSVATGGMDISKTSGNMTMAGTYCATGSGTRTSRMYQDSACRMA